MLQKLMGEIFQRVSHGLLSVVPLASLTFSYTSLFSVIRQTEDDEVDREKHNVSYEARSLKRIFMKLRDGE